MLHIFPDLMGKNYFPSTSQPSCADINGPYITLFLSITSQIFISLSELQLRWHFVCDEPSIMKVQVFVLEFKTTFACSFEFFCQKRHSDNHLFPLS